MREVREISIIKTLHSPGSAVSVVSRLGSPSKNGPQYFAAFAATLGNLIMGTCIGWSSPAGPLLKAEPGEDGFSLSDQQISWVGCLMPAGALLGKIFSKYY